MDDNKDLEIRGYHYETPTNTYGVVGFVFALVGLFTCGGGALIGLPLSIIGCFPKIAGTRKNGLAIAGCIIAGIQICIWLAVLLANIVCRIS